jgi:hypothetical protein
MWTLRVKAFRPPGRGRVLGVAPSPILHGIHDPAHAGRLSSLRFVAAASSADAPYAPIRVADLIRMSAPT